MSNVLDLTLSDDDEDDVYQSYAQMNASHSATNVKHESQQQSDCTTSETRRPQFNNDLNAPKLTIVNGKGFWKSWTRSFKTTMLKLLDLIDNAVDGATIQEDTPGYRAKVKIYPDVYEQTNTTRKGKKYSSTTGLCIRNNSPRKIVPLAEALVVHQTTKIDEGEIGENGVGLKQACAAMCDLSFVLVKNGSNAKIELGIVAKALQREDGPYLPAFEFSNDKEDGSASLREQMTTLFSQPEHNDVAQCVAQYGSDVSGGDPSLAAGIDGLCTRFDDMCYNFEGDNVFEVILNKIRHDQSDDGLVRRAMDVQQKITVHQLIMDLQKEIPRTYLHIPESFEFIVGKKRLSFKYWQRRLVEFSTFTVRVGTTIPWKMNFETSDEHPDAYDLRLFFGFDRFRIVESDFDASTGEKRETKNASLYIYSRQSGRLIKSEPDARHMLGLSAGSSLYASGLTIIIDDIGGNIPLHPTKQDTAFGLEKKGTIHEENLLAWVGGITKYYYNYHLKKYNKQKKVLSAKISHYVDSAIPEEPKTYMNSEFTTFQLIFGQYRGTIKVDDKKSKEIVGSDTWFRLLADPNDEGAAAKGKKRSSGTPQKKKQAEEKNDETEPPSSAKRARTQPISYREDSSSEVEEEEHEHAAVKMENIPSNVDNSECVDLCESSDEEEGEDFGNDVMSPAAANIAAASNDAERTNKITELEQALQQLRGESDSKIESLTNENRALKAELEQKERVISVLKKRLVAK